MAWRLGDLVVCGEILNTQHYSVHGWIGLRDQQRPVILQLTGNPDPDLAGRHIRFEARVSEAQAELPADEPDLSSLAWQQVGPTGTITAAREVKVAECSPTEMYLRSKLGEPPPTKWKRCLYLEWFSQNGRMVIELVDPIIEFVEPGEDAADDSADDWPFPADEGALRNDSSESPPHLDDPQDAGIGDELFSPSDPAPDDEAEDPDDPYGLIPEDLKQQFDLDAAETDRALDHDDEDTSRTLRELELMDDLIENSDGDPIGTIFDTPMKLPLPDQLDDEQAEQALKSLLAQLAVFGIALDICKHFTPREAYRLLLEHICQEERAYPELRQTQWVHQFMTSEFCAECEAELEREIEEYDRRLGESPDDTPEDEHPTDDDLPF